MVRKNNAHTKYGTQKKNQPGSGVVQGVDEHQGESPGKPSTGDVGAEFQPLRGVLCCLKGGLDLVFEGKVEGLGGEVPQNIGKVSWKENFRHQRDRKTVIPLQKG